MYDETEKEDLIEKLGNILSVMDELQKVCKYLGIKQRDLPLAGQDFEDFKDEVLRLSPSKFNFLMDNWDQQSIAFEDAESEEMEAHWNDLSKTSQ